MDPQIAMKSLYFVVSSLFVTSYGQSGSPVVRDYCINEIFQPDCGTDVIIINYALYGRMKLGTCITRGYGVLGCHSNVTDILNQECFAKNSCDMSAMNDRLFNTRPCDELQNYLEVSYSCIQVTTGPRSVCGEGDLLKITAPSTGYLSSLTSRDTGCGSQASPWLIESLEGRHIQVSLLDLTYTGNSPRQTSICLVYALIKEPDQEQSETICGGQSRERVVYRSHGSVVEIKIVSRERQFLLKYEFTGCPAMPPQTGMLMTRDGDMTTVECLNNGEISTFRCNGTRWMGQLPNCTEEEPAPNPDSGQHISGTKRPSEEDREDELDAVKTPSQSGQDVAFDFESITWGMVLIVIGIITGGIVACVFIIAVVYLKRKTIECKGPILVPRPVSEAGYEVCDFDISQCTSSVYRDGYLTVPKDYTPMMNGTLPKYKKPDVWERPLPAEPNHV